MVLACWNRRFLRRAAAKSLGSLAAANAKHATILGKSMPDKPAQPKQSPAA
jgi:hypothetical protein